MRVNHQKMPAITEVRNTPIFFIIGRPRSGTTLLRHLFDAHPNVNIPSECNYILALSRKYKHTEKFDRKTLEKFLEDLKQTKSYDTLSMDDELLKKNVFSVPENITYPELCKIVHASYASIHDKKEMLLIGDKNPAYSSENFTKVFSLFPDAKFIHLIRDYRDQATSLLKARFKSLSPAFIALTWKGSLKTINRCKQKSPENFFTLRYEDFVREPEKHFGELCSFLQIPNDIGVFSFNVKKEKYIDHQPGINYDMHHKSLFQPIDEKRVGIWKDFLKGNELAVAEKIAGNVALQYGYQKSIDKPTLRATLSAFRWEFIYILLKGLRSFIYILTIKRRNYFVAGLKKNKMTNFVYYKIIFRSKTKE